MANDPIMGLPEIDQGDPLGGVRQNNRNLVIARLAIDNRITANNVTSPPTTTRGFAYILSGAGSGLWAGKPAGTIALALSDSPASVAGWAFLTPHEGLLVHVLAGNAPLGTVIHNGFGFVPFNPALIRFGYDPRVVNNTLSTPPGTVNRGEVWIISGTATGQWAGNAANTLAFALDNNPSSAAGWFFYTPVHGTRAWVLAGSGTGHRVWDGSAWVAV